MSNWYDDAKGGCIYGPLEVPKDEEPPHEGITLGEYMKETFAAAIEKRDARIAALEQELRYAEDRLKEVLTVIKINQCTLEDCSWVKRVHALESALSTARIDGAREALERVSAEVDRMKSKALAAKKVSTRGSTVREMAIVIEWMESLARWLAKKEGE
jgi:hypothetical protein